MRLICWLLVTALAQSRNGDSTKKHAELDSKYEEAYRAKRLELMKRKASLLKALKRYDEIEKVRAEIEELDKTKILYETHRDAYRAAKSLKRSKPTPANILARRRAKARYMQTREEYNRLLGLGLRSIFTGVNLCILLALISGGLTVHYYLTLNLGMHFYISGSLSILFFCLAFGIISFRARQWFDLTD